MGQRQTLTFGLDEIEGIEEITFGLDEIELEGPRPYRPGAFRLPRAETALSPTVPFEADAFRPTRTGIGDQVAAPSTFDDSGTAPRPPDFRVEVVGTLPKDPQEPDEPILARLPKNAVRALGAGVLRFNMGFWGGLEAAGDVLGLPSVASWAKQRGGEAGTLAKAVRGPQRGAGPTEQAVYGGFESLGLSVPTLLAGAATANPATSLALFGSVTAGEAYATARSQGVPIAQAVSYAVSQGAIEAATEKIPASRLLRDLTGRRGLGRTLLRQLTTEIPNEQAATAFQDLNDWAVLNTGQPLSRYLATRPSAAAQTLVSTLVATIGQTAGLAAAERVLREKAQATPETTTEPPPPLRAQTEPITPETPIAPTEVPLPAPIEVSDPIAAQFEGERLVDPAPALAAAAAPPEITFRPEEIEQEEPRAVETGLVPPSNQPEYKGTLEGGPEAEPGRGDRALERPPAPVAQEAPVIPTGLLTESEAATLGGADVAPAPIQTPNIRARAATPAVGPVSGPSDRPSAQGGRLSKTRQREADLIAELVSHAQQRGYAGDPAVLSDALTSRAQIVREINQEVDAAGATPAVLLRAIREGGGISEQAETGQKGEIAWLKESPLKQAQGGKVFRRDGPTLDGMVEYLQQDPRFQHITDINDLVEELTDIAQGVSKDPGVLSERALGATGEQWWDRLLPASEPDVTDTGEIQPRLPEAGAVREQEQSTPTFEVPFSLTGDAATRTPVEPSLFTSSPSGGGTEAMAGLFTTTLPVTPGTVKQAVAVQFPEMVELATTLLNTPSVVKRFRNDEIRGQFQARGDQGTIRLRADLFRQSASLTPTTQAGARVYDSRRQQWAVVAYQGAQGPVLRPEGGGGEYTLPVTPNKQGVYEGYKVDISKENAQQLGATLAHEIGHLVDWLPDKTLKRGNLLGRLFTLSDFLKHRFVASDGQTIENKTIRAELMALSDLWRPWDPDAVSANFKAYRHSGKELFADALSVLLTNPGLLEQKAPVFYEQFFNELDNKPDVKRAYFALQEVLAGTPEELIARQRGGVQEMFREGDTEAMDLERLRRRERQLSFNDWWMRFRLQHVDKNVAFIDRVKRLERAGLRVPEHEDPRYLLEERNYLGGKLHVFGVRYIQSLYRTVTTGGIPWHTFGEALFYRRIISGDRSELANPRGITSAVAETLYADLQKGLDSEQQRELQEVIGDFRTMVQAVAEEAHQVGLYKEDLYEQMKQNPAYASYRVIDHLERNVTSRVYHQVGTLKDITNVADATILKVLVTFGAIEHQKVKLGAFQFLEQYDPSAITQAKELWTGKGLSPVDSPDKKLRLVTYFEKGRIRGKYVDPYIAASLNNDSVGQDWAVITALRFANSRLFRPVFTTLNLGFQTFNFARDFWRFWKNIPDMTIGRALQRYRQAVPLARARAFGLRDNASAAARQGWEDLLDAEAQGIFSVTYNDFNAGRDVQDTQIEETLTRLGIGVFQSPAQSRMLKPVTAMLDWIKNVGDFIETLPKAAGIYEFRGAGNISDLTPARRSFIRRKIGSPDFLAGGTWKPVTNELLLFSNAITQAIRSDVEVATNPTTRGGFWWKTIKLNILPKLVYFGALAATTSLLVGPDEEKEEDQDWKTRRLREIGKALRGVSEYDFTNYNILPLGINDQDQAVYVRMPQDDFGRLIGGLTWKLLGRLRGNRETLETAMQVFDYTAGQVPSVTPSLGLVSDVAQFAAGRNVHDPFRSRFLFTDDELKARDRRTFKKFLGYEFQQLGGGIIWRFVPGGERPRQRSTGQKILDFPVSSNIIGRWVRVSNYGETERLRLAQGAVQQTEARRRLTERDVVNQAIHSYLQLPRAEQTDAKREELADKLAQDLHPDDDEQRKARIPILRRKLRVGALRGEADPLVDAILSAQSNAQKTAIIEEGTASMSPRQRQAWLDEAFDDRVISKQLAAHLRERWDRKGTPDTR